MWPTMESHNFRKKHLFLNERRQEPPTFTQYWSLLPSSTTVPDLSHFLGCEPRWFCRNTLSPSDRGASGHVCMSRASVERDILDRMASAFWDHTSRHVGRIDGLLYLMHRLKKAKASRMGLPNTTGDILQSGSGV